MCFVIDRDNPDEKTATKDLVVYKVAEKAYNITGAITSNKVISPIQNFIYDRGRTYKLEESLKVVENPLWPIYKTNHCKFIINEGFHAFTIKMKKSEYIFIIPKGSKYYFDSHNNEIVSDQIRFPSRFEEFILKLKLYFKNKK